jgi:hypothetical protein
MPITRAPQDVGKPCTGEQVGRYEAAGAVKRRLTEREQAGEAKQDVESETEQAPDQDPVHGVGRKAEQRQDEWRRDQARRRQELDQKWTLL